jgi:hypothetical protein
VQMLSGAQRIMARRRTKPAHQPDTGFPSKADSSSSKRARHAGSGPTGVNFSGIPQLEEEHAPHARPASTVATTHSLPSSRAPMRIRVGQRIHPYSPRIRISSVISTVHLMDSTDHKKES